jgi:hypothetical protein
VPFTQVEVTAEKEFNELNYMENVVTPIVHDACGGNRKVMGKLEKMKEIVKEKTIYKGPSL